MAKIYKINLEILEKLDETILDIAKSLPSNAQAQAEALYRLSALIATLIKLNEWQEDDRVLQ